MARVRFERAQREGPRPLRHAAVRSEDQAPAGTGGGPLQPQDWSPDGNSLLAIEVFSNSETYVWLVDVKTGEKTALTPRDGEKAAWFNARFSADGKRVYAISDKSGDKFRIWRCEIATCVVDAGHDRSADVIDESAASSCRPTAR